MRLRNITVLRTRRMMLQG